MTLIVYLSVRCTWPEKSTYLPGNVLEFFLTCMNLVTVVEEYNISVIDVVVLQLSLLRKTPNLIP